MPEFTRQHFIPQGYLKAWCDPDTPQGQEPYIWIFQASSREGKRKAPCNVFHEQNFYTETTPEGSRDLSLEKLLSHLESRFVEIRRDKIEHRQDLEEGEHSFLCAFCAAMRGRTRAMREHTRHQWRQFLEKIEGLEQWLKTAPPDQFRATADRGLPPSSDRSRISADDIRRIVNAPAQTVLPQMLLQTTPILASMDAAILCTTDDLGFITSDAPCLWLDRGRPAGLASPTIEITLPLSPHRLLLLNWQGFGGYIDITENQLDELNRKRRFECEAFYVVRRDEVRDYWFVGEPDDRSVSNENGSDAAT